MNIEKTMCALKLLNIEGDNTDKIRDPKEIIDYIKEKYPNDYEERYGWIIDELETIQENIKLLQKIDDGEMQFPKKDGDYL